MRFIKSNLQNISILLLATIAYIGLGLYISKGSIPNQEGYFELSWNLIYLDFKKIISSAEVTPLIFLVSAFIHKTLQISVSNSWKLMDLIFSSLIMVFLSLVYWTEHKPKKILEKISPILLISTSIGFIYSFTSGSGEGLPLFFAVIGAYFWQKRKFELSVFLFLISYLSKYTMYLIAPGLLIWTIVNIKNYQKKEVIRIFLSGLFLLSAALLYLSLKGWGDLLLQVPYISNFSLAKFAHYLPFYIVTFLIGAPIAAVFYFLNPSKNIFWIVSLSALIMLSRRYFYWNHTQQIIVFALAYFLMHKDSVKLLKPKFLILQVVFTACVMAVLPIYSFNQPLFYKHQTVGDSLLVDQEIYKDYQGGYIGYYLNRRFDEPFPNYEISYMRDDDNVLIENTEYVVIPTVSGIPDHLRNYPQCKYIFHRQVKQNTIYKVQCTSNEK